MKGIRNFIHQLHACRIHPGVVSLTSGSCSRVPASAHLIPASPLQVQHKNYLLSQSLQAIQGMFSTPSVLMMGNCGGTSCANAGSCDSTITYIDGKKGVLLYRG